MAALKIIWKLAIGGGVTFFGWWLLQSRLGEPSITVASAVGLGLMAVGVSTLAGLWD